MAARSQVADHRRCSQLQAGASVRHPVKGFSKVSKKLPLSYVDIRYRNALDKIVEKFHRFYQIFIIIGLIDLLHVD